MSKPKTDAERKEFLKEIGLNPEAPGLADMPAKITTHVPASDGSKVVLAPPGVDPRAMPVEDIVFDPHLLDGFPSLAFNQQGNAASQHVFAFYKSYGRNKDRNGALQRRITSFITLTRRNRETGGMVKEGVKATSEQRDLAALIASQGITAGDLMNLLAGRKEES